MLAAKHEYLCHALFAFTSLHIAHLRPSEADKFTTLATTFRDKTLKALPAMFSRADLDPEEADACFWSSAFVGLIILGQYQQTRPENRQTPKALLLELATVWRGSATVGKVVSPASSRPYETLPTPDASPTNLQTEFGGVLSKVRHCVEREDRSQHSEEFLNCCTVALDDLVSAVHLLDSEGSPRGILSWFSCLDERLLGPLRNGKENGLVNFILVFYGVALHMLENLWYIRDLGGTVVEEFASAIPLKDFRESQACQLG